MKVRLPQLEKATLKLHQDFGGKKIPKQAKMKIPLQLVFSMS
jgi:hypothetical protein